ncbi:bifunctional hydroxymethylpyrimidine kinase/phosphomethylpyrimidine kinase [Natronoglomus mannanivorans]|uniref:Bifunctional hydroxymethylpyrimidine kinase/phosphomethylpyrimidine kinase n=1 Tax=Natronoglomus mannanivorans TaxID=2979990 RepID=A0AAP2Z2M3_9EURY|nr:bifunctional hydroxymethylpyrimidine kinase/phosphomethylpyrimidine kinase [Halobacteria archaeon AArc-xg1-1]
MRLPAPDSRPVALTIAGSDSGGGAGIQADLATMAAHGAFGTSVVTAVTAQHTRGVERSVPLPLEEVTGQLGAVRGDFDVRGAKTGMLATTEIVEAVADRATAFDFPLVVDPVMVATSGDRLLEPAAERAYEKLIAEAAVVTPNADEAEVLTGISVDDEKSAREAGEQLCDLGAESALVKGGHVPGELVRDVLVTGEETVTFEHSRIDTDATHGSGCALSAAIAARLADGDDRRTAVERSVDFLTRAVRYHYDVGQGPGGVNHLVDLRNDAMRAPTAAAVRTITAELADADVSRLVPRGGRPVVGATPYAESFDDVATLSRPNSGELIDSDVRFGDSSDGADVVLAARERSPDVRFAVGCRHTETVVEALESLEWPVCEIGRDGRSKSETAVERPVAVTDGSESIVWIVAADVETVLDRVRELGTRVS